MPYAGCNAAWIAAAERGRVEALKFAYDLRYIQNIHDLCEGAAKNGHRNVLKWMYEVEGGRHFTAYTCKFAAMGGYTEIIQWLRSVGCEWDENVCRGAVNEGRLDTLKWLISNGCPCDVDEYGRRVPSLLELSASKGQVELMRFLINECNANVNYGELSPLFAAVDEGQLEAVMLLLDSGANASATTMGFTPVSLANRLGHTEIVEVLRATAAHESDSE